LFDRYEGFSTRALHGGKRITRCEMPTVYFLEFTFYEVG
jgi:hypothetical protein